MTDYATAITPAQVLPIITMPTQSCFMRQSILFTFTLCLTAHAANPVFTPIGLHINAAFAGQSFKFEPMGYKSGTTVNVHVTTQDLIAIDDKASTIAEFSDNLGNDLMDRNDSSTPSRIGAFPKINAAGTVALFDVHSPLLPGKIADSVKLSGKLVVRAATTKQETVTKHIKLIKGTKLNCGPKTLTVDRVRREDEVLILSLNTDESIEDIAEFSLIDTAGKRTVGARRMTSIMEIGGERRATIGFEIEAMGENFDASIMFWKDMKTVEIPFAIKIGLGL